MDEQPANTSKFRCPLREEILAEKQELSRKNIESVYWKQRAFCVANGIYPPAPPPWLNIPWEPQKGRDPVCVIYVVGMVLLALIMIGGSIWLWRICHAQTS